MRTATSPEARTTFRDRLTTQQRLDGLLVRTPSHNIIEVIAARREALGGDVVLLDAEHAPFDVSALDACLALAHALALPCLVRVPELARIHVQRALDLGATGIVVPHVASAEAAERAVLYAHYGPNGRGFSGSTRAGGFGTRSMAEVLETAAATTTVIVQIEDPAGVDAIDAIVSVPGIDGVFIGPADLAVALGRTRPDDDVVDEAICTVVDACSSAEVPVVAIATGPDDVRRWRDRGATMVLHGTDQALFSRVTWSGDGT